MNNTNTMNKPAAPSYTQSTVRGSVLHRRNNSNNNNNNFHRGRGRSNYPLPGAFFLPPSLVIGDKRPDRSHRDCIADALALLRSAKRRKHYHHHHRDDNGNPREEQQRQQQRQRQQNQQQPPRHPGNPKPQTPAGVFHDQGDENSPIDPNESTTTPTTGNNNNNTTTNKDNNAGSPGARARKDFPGVRSRFPSGRNTKGSEWAIGILPPAAS